MVTMRYKGWHRRIVAAGLLLLFSLPVSGCWDRQELQDRAMLLAIAIDAADDKTAAEQSRTAVEKFPQPHGAKRYRVSNQVLKLGASEEEEESRTFVLSNTGQSILEMGRDVSGQISKVLWLEDLHVIIVSEEAVKIAGLQPIIDFFRRDQRIRWRSRLYITPGKARELLEFKPESGEPGGMFLEAISRNHPKNTHVIAARTDLGFIVQALDNEADVLVPRIEMQQKVVRVGGAAAFKRGKFAGYLDEYAVKGLKFIRATEKSAIIAVRCPLHPEGLLVFELFEHETRLRPIVKGEQVFFQLDINMTGNIGEISCSRHHCSLDPEYRRKAELLFAEEVRRNVLYAQEACQELGIDVLNFGFKLKAYQPKTWAKIKDRWDEIYPTVPMTVSVNVHIRNVGEHK
ncbi:MAG: Ger(x)C family spore germination protein [Negativicutes bacterium]|nr:Ger(x)C family spore germination protein [Negativicutes bacterium]